MFLKEEMPLEKVELSKRITEHLNPRGARVVALEKPSDIERTQWYFQRYTNIFQVAGDSTF